MMSVRILMLVELSDILKLFITESTVEGFEYIGDFFCYGRFTCDSVLI